MKNLEQIRAKNALEAASNGDYTFSGQNDGQVVKKVPTMIMENGILASMAFAIEDKNKGGYEDVFKACIKHLGKTGSVKEFLEELTQETSSNLRAVTAEIMAYLSYLRRFAKK